MNFAVFFLRVIAETHLFFLFVFFTRSMDEFLCFLCDQLMNLYFLVNKVKFQDFLPLLPGETHRLFFSCDRWMNFEIFLPHDWLKDFAIFSLWLNDEIYDSFTMINGWICDFIFLPQPEMEMNWKECVKKGYKGHRVHKVV